MIPTLFIKANGERKEVKLSLSAIEWLIEGTKYTSRFVFPDFTDIIYCCDEYTLQVRKATRYCKVLCAVFQMRK